MQREPAADIGVGHRVQRMRLHAGFAEQALADEQMAHEERAAGGGKDRADDRDGASSASSRASATGPMLPSGVESKVEQYLNRN
jgi:hypothetical protein